MVRKYTFPLTGNVLIILVGFFLPGISIHLYSIFVMAKPKAPEIWLQYIGMINVSLYLFSKLI